MPQGKQHGLKSIFHVMDESFHTFECGSQVQHAVFSHDERLVLAVLDGGAVKIFDAAAGTCLNTIAAHPYVISSAVFSQDDCLVLTASGDGKAKIFDVMTGACLRIFEGHNMWVNSAIFSHDGRLVFVALRSGTVWIFDVPTGDCLRILAGHQGVRSVDVSHDDRFVLTGSGDGLVRLFDIETGHCLRVFDVFDGGPPTAIRSAVFSHDDRLVLADTTGKTLRIFDTATGAPVGNTVHLLSSTTTVVVSRDRRHALTAHCSSCTAARIIDLSAGGHTLRTFWGHKGTVNSAVFSRDERRFLTASADCTVKLWNVHHHAQRNTLALLCCMKRQGVNTGVAAELWDQFIFDEFLRD
jgi:WD40 repeat protein